MTYELANNLQTGIHQPFHLWHDKPLAKIIGNVIFRRMASCVVSYVDTSGIRHTVEVEAESLYEAVVLGVQAFQRA